MMNVVITQNDVQVKIPLPALNQGAATPTSTSLLSIQSGMQQYGATLVSMLQLEEWAPGNIDGVTCPDETGAKLENSSFQVWDLKLYGKVVSSPHVPDPEDPMGKATIPVHPRECPKKEENTMYERILDSIGH